MQLPTVEYISWLVSGRRVPASGNIKRRIMSEYAQKYNLDYFVETGTFNGDTIAALENQFKKLDSIELAKDLFEKAKHRFEGNDKVKIWFGDSGEVLKKIVPKLAGPALFWLDAHGSGGVTTQGKVWSPILSELETICREKYTQHVILIDDARGFTGHLSPTIAQIEKVISAQVPQYDFQVEDDIIRIVLRSRR